ncbi:MAG: TetR/AcrR family transcriptional regulator [Nocardioides sp.]
MTTPPTGVGSRDARVTRTRAKVLDATRRIMAGDGLDAVTHQRVATEARVARATMYTHWPNRTALLLDAVAEMPLPAAAPSTGDLRTDLLSAVEVMTNLLAQPAFVAVLAELIARAEANTGWSEARSRLSERADRPLASLIDNASNDEELGPINPSTAVALLLGPLLFRRLVQGRPIDDDFVAESINTFLIGQSIAPITPDKCGNNTPSQL